MESKPKRRLRGEESQTQETNLLQQLNSLSDDWFPFLEKTFTKELVKKFDNLIELRKNNAIIENSIKDLRKSSVIELSAKIGSDSNDIDECLSLLSSQLSQIQTECQTLKEVLKARKTEKTKVNQKLNKENKRLDSLKTEYNRLNEQNDENEIKELSKIMKLRYIVSSNQGLVTFDFKDRKKNQKSINSQSDDISEEFWDFLNTKYNL